MQRLLAAIVVGGALCAQVLGAGADDARALKAPATTDKATPGVTPQEARVSSKPGETPTGTVRRTVSVTPTITAIELAEITDAQALAVSLDESAK